MQQWHENFASHINMPINPDLSVEVPYPSVKYTRNKAWVHHEDEVK